MRPQVVDPSAVPRRARFSRRTEWDTAENPWAHAVRERRERGLPVYDLTVGNPTECGFAYDPHLLDALTDPAALHYAADPLGLLQAREAVGMYYKDHQQEHGGQLSLDPRQVLLTASTSEAYSFLFRLLCDPGDEVLIAKPGYPLFDFLADLDGVRLVTYPLFYDYGWHIDMHALEQRISGRTRAIVIVHPNNPTGHFTSREDRQKLERLAANRNLALIVDEVFLDYPFDEPAAGPGLGESFALGEHEVLTFVLSGLSKVAGLPQVKLSWVTAFGPPRELADALARLEVIADTFLSVSSPAQHALGPWLGNRHALQQQVRARTLANLEHLDVALQPHAQISRLVVEAGWYAILRVPTFSTGEELAVHLLASSGVLVHPGSFFGMASEGSIVLSLLPEPDAFAQALERLLAGLSSFSVDS